MNVFKKVIVALIILYTSSVSVFADMMRDLEISNELLAITEYGAKISWTADELENIEILRNEFTDDNLIQVWTANILMYSLTTQPTQCDIAERNLSLLSDENLKTIWEQNYNLYGC